MPDQGTVLTTQTFRLLEEKISERMDLRYNTVKLATEYRERGEEQYRLFTDRKSTGLFINLKETMEKLSKANYDYYVDSDRVPEYDPYKSYFESLQWDGKDYIKELTAYIKVEDTPALYDFYWQLKKWLVRCIKCALEPRYFNKQILVFVGEEQNTGKTTFCRWLCPPALKDYYSEEVTRDKDEKIQLVSNIFILYDELVKLNKAGLEDVKALLSKETVKFRPPYARREEIFARRCSFIGNTNYTQFLTDETGNVRFLCFLIKNIDFAYSKSINIDNIWAQAYHLYNCKFACDMTKEELEAQREYCKRFFATTTEHDMIIEYLRPATLKDEKNPAVDVYHWQTGQILQYLTENLPTIKMYSATLGKALKFLGFERKSIKTPQGPKYVYEVVPRSDSYINNTLKSCMKK